MHIFTYGSLMFDPVWQRVVRGSYDAQLARLQGYQRFAIADETYPAVLRRADARVDGRLYLDVSPEDVARLDAFEGEDYRRIGVEVLTGLPGGRREPAQVYLYLRDDRVLPVDWDVAWFEREGIHRFMAAW